jgi:hypothetical protein
MHNSGMMKHLEPKPDTDLTRLEHIFWDYNYQDSGKSLYDFVLGKKEIDYLNRNQVKARMLMTVGWYNLIEIFGLRNLKSFLTDDVLKWVWVDELRNQYKYVAKITEQTLS